MEEFLTPLHKRICKKVVKNNRIKRINLTGLSELDLSRSGFRYNHLPLEMIPGSSGKGDRKWAREEKEANKWCITDQVTTVDNWGLILQGTSETYHRTCPQNYPTKSEEAVEFIHQLLTYHLLKADSKTFPCPVYAMSIILPEKLHWQESKCS